MTQTRKLNRCWTPSSECMQKIGAFRTDSQVATHVIARLIPKKVLAGERVALYQQQSQITCITVEVKKEKRQKNLQRWQKLWADSNKGRWKQPLILLLLLDANAVGRCVPQSILLQIQVRGLTRLAVLQRSRGKHGARVLHIP